MTNSSLQKSERGCIQISTYAFVNSLQAELSFAEHLLPLRNSIPDPAFVVGAYGLNAAAASAFLASDHGRSLGLPSLTLRLFFHVRGGVPRPGAIDRRIAAETGFLHLARLEKGYREEIRQLVLGVLRSTLRPDVYERTERASLHEIMLLHPDTARAVLIEDPNLDVVVHPALTSYRADSQTQGRLINVATVRASRAEQMEARVRYLEHIRVRTGRLH
ncbi:MAG: hypothetical protein ABI702_00385 [Burkholderiales bacterium]